MQGDPVPACPATGSCGASGPGAVAAEDARRRWHGWLVDTALPAMAPWGCQAGARTLQVSRAFVPLRAERPAPGTALGREAPGSLFCALKVHIKFHLHCLLGGSSQCHLTAAPVRFQDRRGHHQWLSLCWDVAETRGCIWKPALTPRSGHAERRGKCRLFAEGPVPPQPPAQAPAPVGAGGVWESPRRKPRAKKDVENLVSFTVRCGLGWPRIPVGNGFLSLVAKPESAGG